MMDRIMKIPLLPRLTRAEIRWPIQQMKDLSFPVNVAQQLAIVNYYFIIKSAAFKMLLTFYFLNFNLPHLNGNSIADKREFIYTVFNQNYPLM